jgi:hypothetical protein
MLAVTGSSIELSVYTLNHVDSSHQDFVTDTWARGLCNDSVCFYFDARSRIGVGAYLGNSLLLVDVEWSGGLSIYIHRGDGLAVTQRTSIYMHGAQMDEHILRLHLNGTRKFRTDTQN